MTQARINFLNWRPDAEDTEHDGLTVADNVVHEPSGYKPIGLTSGGAFATTGGLASVSALVAKPVGNQGDYFCAWLSADTLHVGINGVTATSAGSAGGGLTGYPLSFATAAASNSAAIHAFDVCEYAGKIVFTVEARASAITPATTMVLQHFGYMDY